MHDKNIKIIKNMITITTNARMLERNTFGIDVQAELFGEYENIEGLRMILSNPLVEHRKHDIWNIGQGSNILFSGDFKGIILHGKIKGIKVVGEDDSSVLVKIGAGEIWDDIVEWAVDHNYYGAENLSAIPGEVGAAAVQNIGAYGSEFGNLVESVEVLNTETLQKELIAKDNCQYGYRESIFKHQPVKQRYVVTGVVIRLSKKESFNLEYGNIKSALEGKQINLHNVRKAIVEIRTNKLPDWKKLGNAGSFFKNPIISQEQFEQIKELYPNVPSYKVEGKIPMVKVPAGWLIENSGLKGFCHGGAHVYEKQCLVLINTGNAKAKDIVELSDIVIRTVKEKFNIEISPEVNIL